MPIVNQLTAVSTHGDNSVGNPAQPSTCEAEEMAQLAKESPLHRFSSATGRDHHLRQAHFRVDAFPRDAVFCVGSTSRSVRLLTTCIELFSVIPPTCRLLTVIVFSTITPRARSNTAVPLGVRCINCVRILGSRIGVRTLALIEIVARPSSASTFSAV